MAKPQLTLRQQLKDPIFKKWFAKKPSLEKNQTHPWRLYLQVEEGGPWSKRDVANYSEGYKLVVASIKDVYDLALSHKVKESRPPVVKNALGKRQYHIPNVPSGYPSHYWCTFCRRVTRFGYFRRHHNMPAYLDSASKRCCICGVRLVFIRRYP